MGVADPFRPLRRYADFRGRATRTELVLFYLVVAGLIFVLDRLEPFLDGPDTRKWVDLGLAILLVCPIAALMARRLHDVGRNAWWLLLGLPMIGMLVWEASLRFNDQHALSPIDELPLLIKLALALTVVLLAIFLLWDDDPDDNPYGPNPRYGPVEAAA